MTEKELRQQVCQQARSWLGCRETDGSHRPIVDRYNAIRPLPGGHVLGYQEPWCAAFVSAVGAACGLERVLLPHCGCEAMIGLYRAAGRWEEADEAVPAPGDLLFYDWEDEGRGDCRGTADHVGIVLSVTGNLLQVIEGNKSDAVGLRSLPLDSRFIRGYAKPDYASLAEAAARPAPTPAASAPAPTPAAQSRCALSLPQLRRGDKGETVRAAQLLLIGRGFRCGPAGADGDFGPGTYGGLIRFQRGRQLSVDGILGPESWQALLGL